MAPGLCFVCVSWRQRLSCKKPNAGICSSTHTLMAVTKSTRGTSVSRTSSKCVFLLLLNSSFFYLFPQLSVSCLFCVFCQRYLTCLLVCQSLDQCVPLCKAVLSSLSCAHARSFSYAGAPEFPPPPHPPAPSPSPSPPPPLSWTKASAELVSDYKTWGEQVKYRLVEAHLCSSTPVPAPVDAQSVPKDGRQDNQKLRSERET